jgi:hypothetical protein
MSAWIPVVTHLTVSDVLQGKKRFIIFFIPSPLPYLSLATDFQQLHWLSSPRHVQRMRFGRNRNVILVIVAVVGGFPLLISESNGFTSNSLILLPPSSPSAITTTSVHFLHLLNNGNRISQKRLLAEHGASSHPKQYSHWDGFLIPSSLRPKQQQEQHDHVTTLDKTFVVGFIGLFGAILYKFVTNSSPGSWRYFLAGGLCAASSHAIPTPIDVIKV